MIPPVLRACDRRSFLRGALLTGGLPLLVGGCAGRPRPHPQYDPATAHRRPAMTPPAAAATGTPHLLPAPDLAQGRVLRFAAGVRPFRAGRVRIEPEALGPKLLVHNYGHGGAGVTLSWGSAQEVTRLVRGRRDPDQTVAVIGAGVIGLTTACQLLRDGHRVRIYAKAVLEGTTSWLAGAQWAPSLVAQGHPPGDEGFFDRLVRASHAAFTALADTGEWGVSRRPNFVAGAAGGGLAHIPDGLFPPPEPLERLPLAGVQAPGLVYRTMLIEPPVFLPRLADEVRSLGGEFERRTFGSLADVTSLREPVVVNCLGLGARDVLDDPRLVPVRGQLVHVQPQDLPYLLSHERGYLFPRRDALVLGGTVERGVDDATPDEAAGRRILEHHRRFFRALAHASAARATWG